MIKNVALKKILKSSIFKCISLVNKVLPKDDNLILLHIGNKGINYNLRELYDYLMENGYNQKYHIVCSVESEEYFEKTLYNVEYVTHIRGLMTFLKAGHVFYTAGQLPVKPSQKQCVIHTQHGSTDYKTMGALTKIDNGDEFFFSYMIATAPIYVPIEAKEYRCPEKCIAICSEPMVDRLVHPKKRYVFEGYRKILLWTPTFRKSDYLGYNDVDSEDVIPMFKNGDYEELNARLEKIGCLLLVKIHPNQSTEGISLNDLSNIRIYTQERFDAERMNLYDLMASVDGLLGDYSTTSLQFLLTEKPMAYVIPDIEEYSEKRGFVFDNPIDYMPGHIIKTKEELWLFLTDFVNDIDEYKEERKHIKNIIHFYQDGHSCEKLMSLSNISI